MKFKITTLGCKVNQYESETLARSLGRIDGGKPAWTPAGRGETADVCVINTCTVTGKAAMQSRQAIRRAARNHPRAKIIVTGCYAQTAPHEIARMERVDAIIGHQEKGLIAEKILGDPAFAGQKENLPTHSAGVEAQTAGTPPAKANSRTRPFVKIQDGCNSFCTYCIVPHARGRSRSRMPNEVLDQVAGLGRAEYREVVLTGIHLGCYGVDLTPPTRLVDLIRRMQQLQLIDRIRLSSIEPRELTDDILELSATSAPATGRGAKTRKGVVCPHFHVPMQSGDDRILKAMGRPYTAAFFSDRVEKIHRRIPHAAIGVDVLVGFPGEDQGAFENTYGLLERLPVSYLHVFPFSARKGTPAYSYPDRVPVETLRRRSERLRRLGRAKKRRFTANLSANPWRSSSKAGETGRPAC